MGGGLRGTLRVEQGFDRQLGYPGPRVPDNLLDVSPFSKKCSENDDRPAYPSHTPLPSLKTGSMSSHPYSLTRKAQNIPEASEKIANIYNTLSNGTFCDDGNVPYLLCPIW